MAKMLLYFRTNSIDLFNSIDISSSDIYILALTQQLHKFISIMESLQLNIEVNVILWTLFANNSFSVKTCYVLINDGRIRLQLMHIPRKEMLFDFTVDILEFKEIRQHIIDNLMKFEV